MNNYLLELCICRSNRLNYFNNELFIISAFYVQPKPGANPGPSPAAAPAAPTAAGQTAGTTPASPTTTKPVSSLNHPL